jgi:hypothetical protein
VFSKHNDCEREDIHACHLPDADKLHCLQVTLKLPRIRTSSGNPSSVTALSVTGFNYARTSMWAADNTGQMTVWNMPDEGLNFTPAKTWRAHKLAVNDMASTWRHMISVSDDGCVLIHDLKRMFKVRSINLVDWCLDRGLVESKEIVRRLKCLCLHEDTEQGNTLTVGNSYGEIIVMSLGSI